MKITVLLLSLFLVGCGGGGDFIPIPSAKAQTIAPIEVVQLHAILRPDNNGRWYIQDNVDHTPLGISLTVEQTSEFVRIFFNRTYKFAGTIQVTSDDDFNVVVNGYSNLGLNSATIRVYANGKMIDPATVYNYIPVGSGNFWINATMVNK